MLNVLRKIIFYYYITLFNLNVFLIELYFDMLLLLKFGNIGVCLCVNKYYYKSILKTQTTIFSTSVKKFGKNL